MRRFRDPITPDEVYLEALGLWPPSSFCLRDPCLLSALRALDRIVRPRTFL